jgi:hypothetical protein
MYGLVTKKAQYVDWVEDRLRVPSQILLKEDLASHLRVDVHAVEKAASIVYNATYAMTPREKDKKEKKDQKEKKGKKGKKGKEDKENQGGQDEFARQSRAKFFDEVYAYLFGGYLNRLAQSNPQEKDWHAPLVKELCEQLSRIANGVLNEAVAALGLSSKGMETAAKALKIAYLRLKKLMKQRG